MQNNSIFNENYNPLYIQEMDEDTINYFAKVVSQKLGNVKLAITKSNVNSNKYSKMDDLEDPRKKFSMDDLNKKKKNIKHLNPINIKKKMMNHVKFSQTARDTSMQNPFKVFEMRELEFKEQITDLDKPFALLSNKVGKMRTKLPHMEEKRKTSTNFPKLQEYLLV